MVLGISEDFSTDVTLDSELTSIPSNGLYMNSGVHPIITLNNLLEFLPSLDFTISDWNIATIYGKYSETRKKSDLVVLGGKIYQSLVSDNEGNSPDEVDNENWLETNKESLRLKMFLKKVQDKVYSDLYLTKRLINNQYIYEVGENEVQLPNNYSAWVFEPKGSDYVSITLNQVSFQKNDTAPTNLYVVNQGVLVTTLQIVPSNGIVDFKNLNYTFKGNGKWIFAIDSTSVLIGGGVIDPLQYDGFVCYTANGIGETPEGANYSFGSTGNGLGFNVSATLDSQVYIDNNIEMLGNFVRSTFELMALQMFLHNSENRSNRTQQIQMDKDALIAETKSLDMNTVAKRHQTEYSRAKRVIDKAFDTQVSSSDDYEIETSSI